MFPADVYARVVAVVVAATAAVFVAARPAAAVVAVAAAAAAVLDGSWKSWVLADDVLAFAAERLASWDFVLWTEAAILLLQALVSQGPLHAEVSPGAWLK